MKKVTEQEFKDFFINKWFVVFNGFFKDTKKFIIDGHYIGFKDVENKIFRLDYRVIKQYNL